MEASIWFRGSRSGATTAVELLIKKKGTLKPTLGYSEAPRPSASMAASAAVSAAATPAPKAVEASAPAPPAEIWMA